MGIVKNIWKSCYSFIIPSSTILVYVFMTVYLNDNKIFMYLASDDDTIVGNVNSLLEAMITFITIVIGVFGFLLPVLLTNKKDCGMVEFFLSRADKKKFTGYLKSIIISGFAIVAFCAVMFLREIFFETAGHVFIGLIVWLAVYFICSSYRFISLILDLLIYDRDENREDEVINQMNESEINELNERIRQNNNNGNNT